MAVIGINRKSDADLFQIGQANNGARLFFGHGQGGQQHRGKDGDDRDHDQQLDESKTSRGTAYWLTCRRGHMPRGQTTPLCYNIFHHIGGCFVKTLIATITPFNRPARSAVTW
jgi:hypothetical protein